MGTFLPYWRFELRRLTRNRQAFAVSVIAPAFMYILNANQTNSDIGGINWRTFFLGSMVAFAVLSAALVVAPTISRDRASGWNHQLRITPMPAPTYAVTKLIAAILLSILPPAVIVVIGLRYVHLRPATIAVLLVVLLASCVPFAALGMLAGYLVQPRALHLVLSSLIVVLGLAGGLFMPLPALPSILHTPVQALPSHHLAQVIRAVAAGRTIPATSALVLTLYAAAFLALVAWRFRHDETSSAPAG